MNLEHIYNSFVGHFDRLTSSIGGWVMISIATVVNFLGGYVLAFTSVVFCVMCDAVFGIASALKRGKFTRSDLLRDTISKVGAYSMALVAFAFIEKLVSMDMPYIVNPIAAIICCTELLSIAGNALIVNPNLTFFKLLTPALKGEIAQKLKIKEDEVENAIKDLEKSRESKSKKTKK